MPQVNFTSALKRFFPDLEPVAAEGKTVAEVLDRLNQKYPGIKDYVVDERGKLRKHVNIFIGEHFIQDRDSLQDSVSDSDTILIFQALSGG